jgi:hypothetical protein
LAKVQEPPVLDAQQLITRIKKHDEETGANALENDTSRRSRNALWCTPILIAKAKATLFAPEGLR